MLTYPFIKKIIKLSLISSLPIFLASCGVAGRKLVPDANPVAPGGGSGQGSGSQQPLPPPASTLNITNPALDFSTTIEEIGSQQEEISFSAVNDSIYDFSVDLDETAKSSGDWTLSKLDTCSSTLTLGKKCIVTVTFTPKQATIPSPASLIYSYTNSKQIPQPAVSIILASDKETFQPLYTAKISTLNQGGLLETLISSMFIKSTFIGLTNIDYSLNSFDMGKTTPVQNKIAINAKNKRYNSSSFLNTIFYTFTTDSSSYLTSITKSPSTPPISIDKSVISVAADTVYTYGADYQGNIVSIGPKGNILANLVTGMSNTADIITADLVNNKNTQTIYGVFSDSTNAKHFICQIIVNLPSPSVPPNCIENDTALANAMPGEIIAYNGTVFVFTYQNRTLTITGFNDNLKNYFTSPSIKADQFYPPVYDKVNNIIYIVGSVLNSYTLYGIDANNGKQSFVQFNQSTPFETMSNAFLTTGAQPKVLSVSSLGKIYAFEKDSSQDNLTLIPFVFNDGKKSNYYLLPTNSTVSFYPKAVALYSDTTNPKNPIPTIFIPSYDSNTSIQKNYLFQINW